MNRRLWSCSLLNVSLGCMFVTAAGGCVGSANTLSELYNNTYGGKILLVQNFAELLLSRPLKEIFVVLILRQPNYLRNFATCKNFLLYSIYHNETLLYVRFIYITRVMGNFCWCKISLNCYPDLQNVVFAAAKLSVKFWTMQKFPAIVYNIQYMCEIYLHELCESSSGRISLYHINFYRAIRYNA